MNHHKMRDYIRKIGKKERKGYPKSMESVPTFIKTKSGEIELIENPCEFARQRKEWK